MRGTPLRITGSLKVRLLVTRGRDRPRTINGSATSNNVRDDFGLLYHRAVQDAIAQYKYLKGEEIQDSGTLRQQAKDNTFRYEVLNYYIDYSSSQRFYKIKRVNRNGKYYAEARDKQTGKLKSRTRWSSKAKL